MITSAGLLDFDEERGSEEHQEWLRQVNSVAERIYRPREEKTAADQIDLCRQVLPMDRAARRVHP